jgi:hypothetical protein
MTLNPIILLEKALIVNKPAATVILLVTTISTIVVALSVAGVNDYRALFLAIFYLVMAGVIIILFSFLLNDGAAKVVLSWAVTTLVIVFMSAVAYGAIVPRQTLVNPPSCILRLWEYNCFQPGGILDANAASQPPINPVGPLPAAVGVPPEVRASTKVYVQFAGTISRENMIKASQGLAAQGWAVQGAAKGGERTPVAAGLNEVRYSSPALKAAADAVATQLNSTGITKTTIRSRQVSIPNFPATQLEVWISN